MKLMTTFALLGGLCSAAVAGPPNEEDRAIWIQLYEEEVLAHDLYIELGKAHPGIRPFQNIPHSEARHRDAIGAVLKVQGIEIPKAPEGRRFASEGLDKLYGKLLKKGRKSARAASMVGVRFEETDIADLRAARAKFPDHAELLGQLEFASGNHLRAFHKNLTSRGGKYRPRELEKADFEAILAGEGPEGIAGCGDCGKNGACKGNCADGAACDGNCKGDCGGAKKAAKTPACDGDCKGDCADTKKAAKAPACDGNCKGDCDGANKTREACADGNCEPKGEGRGPGKGPRRGQGPPPGRGPAR